jgi:hypothetical protein
MTKHPMQPIELKGEVYRFKENEIISYLVDSGKINLNEISLLPFKKEDKEQFWQLMGYSVSGYGDVFGDTEVVRKADAIVEYGSMEQPTPLELLIIARSLIAKEKNWCQGDYAKDENGRGVGSLSPDAVRWCAMGALYKAAKCFELGVLRDEMLKVMDYLKISTTEISIIAQNDGPEGHKGVLQMYDKAIAMAVKQ